MGLRALPWAADVEDLERLKQLDPNSIRLGDFQSQSRCMQSFLATAKRLVHADTTLLFLGETGVGKEWMARAIHSEGHRHHGPFIPINCAGIPDGLLDSELFGHEVGAFTGATRRRRGVFELARGGTVFLDEIGEMPLHMQVKLLRVLQDRTVQRLGSERCLPIDVRVMAATNRDLQADVRAGRFREDLYYRLGVLSISLPPLRDRAEDIPQLLHRFLDDHCRRLQRGIKGFTEEAMKLLVAYAWPGNIRELINTVERAVLLCDVRWIDSSHLPVAVCQAWNVKHSGATVETERLHASAEGAACDPNSEPLRPMKDARAQMLARWERAYLSRCLTESHGSIQEAAARAAINPRSLREMMRRHGLRKEQFRWRPK